MLLSSCHFVFWVNSVTCSECGWHGTICVWLLACRIPGRLNDRRTPLGELNWIFTAITDTIAWNVLPRGEAFHTQGYIVDFNYMLTVSFSTESFTLLILGSEFFLMYLIFFYHSWFQIAGLKTNFLTGVSDSAGVSVGAGVSVSAMLLLAWLDLFLNIWTPAALSWSVKKLNFFYFYLWRLKKFKLLSPILIWPLQPTIKKEEKKRNEMITLFQHSQGTKIRPSNKPSTTVVGHQQFWNYVNIPQWLKTAKTLI